ncbi:MAG: hypothetical protein C0504_16675 [Candidatus Solibacter sp.]|nr:hypothetical protein [Candidatus Solibacter sp.]
MIGRGFLLSIGGGNTIAWAMLCVALVMPDLAAEQKYVSEAVAQKWAAAGFRPAVFEGLLMGKAKRGDVIARFGKPVWEGRGEGGGLCLSYRDIGGFKGIANFWLNSKTLVVNSLDIAPQDFTKEQAVAKFGKGAVLTRWSMATCFDLGWGLMGPSYLDPHGELFTTEYRHLGIMIEGATRVRSIDYMSRPLGLDRDPCKDKDGRKKTGGTVKK